MKKLILVVPLLLLHAAALADDKPYPHKAGVTVKAMQADRGACLDAAAQAKNRAVKRTEGDSTANVAYFSCMSNKGYTQRALPAAELAAMKKLPTKEQISKMHALISAPEPAHPEVPRDKLH